MDYYAHSNEWGKANWQKIKEHLENTAAIAQNIGQDAGLSDFAYIAGLFHDLGKYSARFQNKLDGALISVDHSTAGAQEIVRLFQSDQKQKIIATLLAYCIAGHHSGLPDYGSVIDCENDGSLQARLKKKLDDYAGYSQEINPEMINLPASIPIRPIKRHEGFSVAFFTRMLYSTLVDADFLETETFINQGKKPRGEYTDVETLFQRLSPALEKLQSPSNSIDQKRTETLNCCLEKAVNPPGLFTLTVPTGGGKTFSSLAFTLKHAVLHGLKRIIYVIPYTSIIEQNAAVFKEKLGIENVLEHHSNFEWNQSNAHNRDTSSFDDETNQPFQKLKLAAENWDIPVVVTTNVQFFESLFANRSSRCRKLHNLAKSVLIFDEAQMLPREYMKPCLYAVAELVRNYGASAVFCTATQPCIEQFLPPASKPHELTTNSIELYNFYRRVQVHHLGKLSDLELSQKISDSSQALCIVNTRKHANGLFSMIKDEGRFHLSTLMCPAHRKQTIEKVRERLKAGLPCRVVSTQIMEAGIDVDFPVGYRALSGLDSIIQAAGRVNREGKAASGDLYVFEPDSEFVKRTPAYIQQGADVARKILRDYRDDPISLAAIQSYYTELYGLQSETAFDSKAIMECFEKGIPNFDFKTAAEKFRLIENATVSVIVPFDPQTKRILEKVRFRDYPRAHSRELQPYTVNIYEQEFEALESKGVIDIYGDTFAVLNDAAYYNAETGLIIPEHSGGDALFFDG